jgi:hypothetical protein
MPAPKSCIDYNKSSVINTVGGSYPFLPSEYNLILFFSLPFYPISRVYKKTFFLYGHLSLALGNTVYQLHDPLRLRSSFLVSKMPVATWLFSDGDWYGWNTASPTYRHVHLYEKAEVKRTAVFYAAFKGFPVQKQTQYEQYFEKTEQSFQEGTFHFKLISNNCTRVISNIFYQEQWFRKGPLDFVPAITFKRLVSAWNRLNLPFAAGHFQENNPAQFRVHNICYGLFTRSPDRELVQWLMQRGNQPERQKHCPLRHIVHPSEKHHEVNWHTKTAGL